MLLRNLGIAQTDEYRVQRSHLNKKTIANHLTLLISLLNLAIELNWIVKRPRIKKPKIPIFSCDFRYLRSKEELDRFLLAAEAEGEYAYTLYLFTTHTGMRQGEVAALKKSSVDFQKRLITVQNSFEGPTKADDVRYVPILDPLLPVLERWVLKTPGDLVFPNEAGNMHQPSARIFQETLHRMLDAAGFPKKTAQRAGKPITKRYVTFHDLRHTFAS